MTADQIDQGEALRTEVRVWPSRMGLAARARWVRAVLGGALLSSLLPARCVSAFDPDAVLVRWGQEVSAEGTIAHFGARLGEQYCCCRRTGSSQMLPSGRSA